MPNSKCGLSWKTVDEVASMMSEQDIFAPDRSRRRSEAPRVEDIHHDFFALAVDLVVALRAEEVEALGADRFHEGGAASGEDHHAISCVPADLMEEVDKLLMGEAIEDQRVAIRMQG